MFARRSTIVLSPPNQGLPVSCTLPALLKYRALPHILTPCSCVSCIGARGLCLWAQHRRGRVARAVRPNRLLRLSRAGARDVARGVSERAVRDGRAIPRHLLAVVLPPHRGFGVVLQCADGRVQVVARSQARAQHVAADVGKGPTFLRGKGWGSTRQRFRGSARKYAGLSNHASSAMRVIISGGTGLDANMSLFKGMSVVVQMSTRLRNVSPKMRLSEVRDVGPSEHSVLVFSTSSFGHPCSLPRVGLGDQLHILPA